MWIGGYMRMPIPRNILERLRKVQNELYFDGVKNIGRMYLEYVFLEFWLQYRYSSCQLIGDSVVTVSCVNQRPKL